MSNSADEVRQPEGETKRSNWPLMRKVEALVFLAMFLALPLFAFRVLQYTHAQLTVRNVGRDLVHDLARVKSIAIQLKENVEVTGRTSANKFQNLYSYSIKTPTRLLEDIVLPENVSVVGTVTFTPHGSPTSPSSFIVSSFNRNMTVEIDQKGEVSVP